MHIVHISSHSRINQSYGTILRAHSSSLTPSSGRRLRDFFTKRLHCHWCSQWPSRSWTTGRASRRSCSGRDCPTCGWYRWYVASFLNLYLTKVLTSYVLGTRERQLESILQSTLRQIVLIQSFPRSLIQVTLQITSTPEIDSAGSKLVQAASVLG